MEERVLLVNDDELGESRQVAQPDVALIHKPAANLAPTIATVATLEPHTLPQEMAWLDEPKQLYIKVIHLPDRRLVTDIEVLSPSNKRRGGDDRAAYLACRRELVLRQVHLVEIDLLLAGDRLPMLAPLPKGEYFAFVTRWATGRHCDVYAWSIRQPLPTIPIPLRSEDGSSSLDLTAAFAQTYDRGRYDRMLRYGETTTLRLAATDQVWASEQLAAVK